MKKNLTAIQVKNAPDGTLRDGAGLMLKKKNGRGKWVWRYTYLSRKHDMGLGAWPEVSLAEARKARDDYAHMLRQGTDPLTFKKETEAAARAKQNKEDPPFEVLVYTVFDSIKDSLRDGGNRGRWLSGLQTHVLPKIGRKPGSQLTPSDIVDVIKPIWKTKHPTALKTIRRISKVLRTAKNMGYPVDPSIEEVARTRLGVHIHKETHLASAKWEDIPRIFSALSDTSSGRCNQWIILTLVRMESARGARVSEIDFENAIWTVPAERMKGTEKEVTDFRVPLTEPCLQIAREVQAVGLDCIFPGSSKKGLFPITNAAVEKSLKETLKRENMPHATPHGMRSSFRTWVQDTGACDSEVAETILAHVVGNEVQRAYARSDLLERRRKALQLWSEFVIR